MANKPNKKTVAAQAPKRSNSVAPSESKKSSWLTHGLIVGIFLIFSIGFCWPAFQGNYLNQGDFWAWRNSSEPAMNYYAETGENVFWLNNSFSGMPSVTSILYSKSNWFKNLTRAMVFQDFSHPNNPAPYFFWGMISFYLLMLALRAKKWASAVGALGFAFSSYIAIIITAGHATKVLDIALLPGVLAGILLVYRNKFWLGGAVSGLFIALFLSPGHYQIIYYGLLLVGAVILAELVRKIKAKELKQWLFGSALLLVLATLAGATKGVELLPTQQYTKHSIRGGTSELSGEMHSKSGGLDKAYAFQWSNGLGELLSTLVPDLYGGSSGENIGTESEYGKRLAALGVPPQQVEQMTLNAPTYWGPQPFLSGPVYFGAVICFLMVLSILVVQDRLKWWLLGASVFFILLSLGKHFAAFNYPLFDHLPMLNKFRTPSMALSIPLLLFPMMGAWAFSEILKGKLTREQTIKNLKIALGITGGLLLLVLAATFVGMDFKAASDSQIMGIAGDNEAVGQQLVNAIHADRASMARTSTFRSLIFVLLSAGLIWAYALGKLNKMVTLAGIGVLVCIDEIPIAHRYLNENHFMDQFTYEQQYQPREVDKEILKDTEPTYRVFDLTRNSFNDSKTPYFHRSVGGYSPAKLEIYQELIENQLGNLNAAVIDMLNTKYLIVPDAQGQPRIQKNPNACGPAWFVEEIKWAKDARSAMDALDAPSLQNPLADSGKIAFEPLKTAVLRDSLQSYFKDYQFGKSEEASIIVKSYDPKHLIYETNNTEAGLAVFSEIFVDEGWTATIDGEKTKIFRTDYVLRALKVPAGKHTIEFKYMAPGFEKGEKWSLIGSIGLTLMILLSLAMWYKGQKKEVKPLEEESR